jgi:integrase
MGLDQKLQDANARLKAAGSRVVIELRNNSLFLRGTLPPKPGSEKRLPHQQRINLDATFTVAGIQYAETEARRVTNALNSKDFTWDTYLSGRDKMRLVEKNRQPTVAELVDQFVREYWRKHEQTDAAKYTLEKDYLAVFKRLPQDIELSEQVIMSAIETTEPNSRARQRYCLALGLLAKQANIPFDPKPYRGKYQPKERKPPTNEEIIVAWEKVQQKSKAWANVLALLATYGLRAHEVFFLDFARYPVVRVNEGKTDARDAYAYPREWCKLFNLEGITRESLPHCTGTHADIGHRVTTQFRRYELAFRPHDLRHAHAIRMIQHNVPVEIAARYHGHSTTVHTRTYQRWLRQEVLDEIWEGSWGLCQSLDDLVRDEANHASGRVFGTDINEVPALGKFPRSNQALQMLDRAGEHMSHSGNIEEATSLGTV